MASSSTGRFLHGGNPATQRRSAGDPDARTGRPPALCYHRLELGAPALDESRVRQTLNEDIMAATFPYTQKIEVDKAPRPKDPKQLAVIDQTGCTGCEACISFCPVDCIEIVPGPVHPDFMKLVEVDLLRCIGCQLCARYCPWETIDMWGYEEGLALAPSKTVRSILYDYDPEQMHEAAEARAQG
jgi:ferredoxin